MKPDRKTDNRDGWTDLLVMALLALILTVIFAAGADDNRTDSTTVEGRHASLAPA